MFKYNTRYQTKLLANIITNIVPSIPNDYQIIDKIISDDTQNIDSIVNDSDEDSYEDENMFCLTDDIVNKLNNKEFNNKLNKIKDFVNISEPNVIEYINEPLIESEKAKLLILYEIYKSTPLMSMEWLNMRDNLNITFKKYKKEYDQYIKYSDIEHINMELESKNIEHEETNISYKFKILNLNTSNQNKAIIYSKFLELEELSPNNDDYGKLKSWIKCALSIPHDNIKSFPFDNISNFLKNVKNKLDDELYGMNNVKEQILLFLNSKLLYPNMKKCSLGLIGPPGCGKTVISKLLSKVLDYPFEQISFGGVNDSNFIKGHDYTYIGSQPGAIVRALQRMKCKNGILYLDEYDKISHNKDVCSALLHITDPEQHTEFRDNYLQELTIDLSNLWFIYSMNTLPSDSALTDRLYIIEVKGYNNNEKVKIICNYLFPKSLKNIGRNITDIIIDEDVALYLIHKVGCNSDKGVRNLDQNINDICNKLNFLVTNKNDIKLSFNFKHTIDYPIILSKNMLDLLINKTIQDDTYHMLYI